MYNCTIIQHRRIIARNTSPIFYYNWSDSVIIYYNLIDLKLKFQYSISTLGGHMPIQRASKIYNFLLLDSYKQGFFAQALFNIEDDLNFISFGENRSLLRFYKWPIFFLVCDFIFIIHSIVQDSQDSQNCMTKMKICPIGYTKRHNVSYNDPKGFLYSHSMAKNGYGIF